MTTAQIRGRLRVLDKLVAVAHATKDSGEILEQSLAVICDAHSAKVAAVYLVEEGRLRLAMQMGMRRSPQALQRMGSLVERWQPCLGSMGVTAWPLSGLDHPAVAQDLQECGCGAVVALPLMAHTEATGCLILGLASENLDELDHEFLRTVGQAIGLGVDNANLYEQMDRRLRESQTLYEISRAFASTRNLDVLLHQIVRLAVGTITNADNGVLHLLDETTGELRPRALSFVGQVRPDRSGRSHMRIGEGLAGIALQEGELLNIPDVSADPRFIRVGAVRRFASMLIAPLKMGQRRLGTLSIDSKRVNAFGDSDERLLTTLATQAAAALENARLVHDLQQSLQDLQQTQAQLIQSAKLSAIGQLIAGVAHELNNPLTAVMGYSQLAQSTPDLDPAVLRDLDKIYTQAGRAARIVQNLLTFAREYKAERQQVDVNDILCRTLELRLYQLRVENIEVETDLADKPLLTMADSSQLQQVFLNLINNAHDAMIAHRGGGRLRLTTFSDQNTICVEVSDDGHGMSADVIEHLFEPFFTTKEVGKGTGLGLSICFGIISEHGGRIDVESEVGQGSTFRVVLPIVQPSSPSVIKKDAAPVRFARDCRTLIVDDEFDVATLLRRILVEQGHDVVIASNGQEALEILAGNVDRPFDLVLSDIKMPGLDGLQLYEHLEQAAPELRERIIFITGDTLNPGTSEFLRRTGLPHLEKPFTLAQLATAMARLPGRRGVSDAREASEHPADGT